ncbi:branched-chain amino acid ABC transporter permease [Haliangium sp.]|uniref:branched-chain amino acid ABC transporter permease n=1 Tax=Haliangium sp. TaxID=2663208 RepID=UPI003D0CF8EC
MTTFLQLTTAGLALGALYALTALGFVVIYRASQVFNFAHGELLTTGAFLMTTMCGVGLPWPLALAATMLATGALAAVIERGVLRPLVGRPVFVTVIATIFIGLLLREGVHVFWGTDVRGMPTPWETTRAFHVGGVSILANALAALIAGFLGLGGFFLLFHRTRLGIAMRASASDQETALALGIPVGRVFAVTWFIAGAYAALAGVFLAMFPRQLDPNLGFVALRAFPAVVVGGLTSPLGTVIAGLLLGLLEMMAQGYVNPILGDFGDNFHEVFAYVVMIAFLMVRPYGLLGHRDVKRA